jgi:hypothetical protein
MPDMMMTALRSIRISNKDSEECGMNQFNFGGMAFIGRYAMVIKKLYSPKNQARKPRYAT